MGALVRRDLEPFLRTSSPLYMYTPHTDSIPLLTLHPCAVTSIRQLIHLLSWFASLWFLVLGSSSLATNYAKSLLGFIQMLPDWIE